MLYQTLRIARLRSEALALARFGHARKKPARTYPQQPTVHRVIHCSSGTTRHAVGPSAFEMYMGTVVILDLNED
jgi:hypothetical protein